ncbi:TPA: tRNA lysidine(34) synthetase TilS [Vibrio vulnificus]|uniref:tRNA lysidine(34) synthetase TilS n=1 Tax=Vibrio vulnificus TaxID=672 RepID=UPI001A2D1081|nr:tRNA lysidine(34) synthetase TilS [Vibrio vulnificus]MCG6278036.1 tRNA lysidine(34) synthetase TilS [Vibrio vulnificus]HAS8171565.1 tRNA lysidine(34) synthetase TilS [Vibrio vulnificus]HAS8445675.1 tRNA lysidine(34) synthetase TilS [Vibrio vulnificus]HAS8455629.1 tRNA lysidine(34) synthetase TilS [Vibrio vulnificus]HDY7724733.1 tRNA lysidine(34) synthetase TilS [Vibrio vulnificus]
MDALYSHFSQVLEQQRKANTRLVVAFSGGVDSRVLLELAHRYAQEHLLPCCAVHVHHGLSHNADQWVQSCAAWCQEKNIPLTVERVQLDLTQGNSIEEEARNARYQALRAHINADDLLLTGQHADDQVETFLLALKRGSGPKGLSSMAQQMPFSQGRLIRPLLDVRRQEIERCAHAIGLHWVEDESNQDTRYDRNFLRQQILPALSERWPSFAASVQRSATLCAEQEALLDELLLPVFEQLFGEDQSLAITLLSQQSELARFKLLRMWLAKLGHPMPTRHQLSLIWQQVALSQADANPILQLSQGQVRRFNQRLYLVADNQDLSAWHAQITLNTPLALPDGLGTIELTLSRGFGQIALPEQSEALWISFNPEGLSAHPAERGHSRKLKKLFQEYQVPSWLRRRTPILMYHQQVVAVAGLFVDRQFIGQDCELFWRK